MKLPVSVKGVVFDGGRAILLKNERDEWELPGGRLEAGETLRECVEREIHEELNLRVEAGPLLDAYVYEVVEGKHVLIVVYGCFAEGLSGMHASGEHRGFGRFDVDGLGAINLPAGYGDAVRMWSEHPQRDKYIRGHAPASKRPGRRSPGPW